MTLVQRRRSSDHSQFDGLKVFISYSRGDARAFVDRLQPALEKHGVDAYVDREDIEKGEEWWERIEQLITEADSVIFVMTPRSAKSEICKREVAFAEHVKKRLLPVVAADIADQILPQAIARLNYISFIEDRNAGASGGFEDSVVELAHALNTDIAWIREHTRIGALAYRWEKSGRPAEMLLRGGELAGGETLLGSRPRNAPEPTSAHIAFVTQSRRVATRRQRIILVISLAVTVIALGLAIYALIQRNNAIQQEMIAITKTVEAEKQQQQALQRLTELCQSWRVTNEWIENNIPAGIYNLRAELHDVFKFDDNCKP